jgi:hypothetical protein
MKIKYTPGTPEGLVGKTYKVEIVEIELVKDKNIVAPLLKTVKIRYEDGNTERISGNTLIDSIDMIQKAVKLIVI